MLRLLRIACLLLSLAAPMHPGAQAMTELGQPSNQRPPNLIVLLSDDQGWGDFGFQGNTNFQTPNMDRLAADGVVCQRF